jgi:hypothetical protein
MNDFLDLEVVETEKKLPPFLKVLCILTFVGAGVGILGAIYAMFMQGFTLRMLENSSNAYQSNPFLKAFDNTEYISVLKKWGQINNLLALLGSGLCLFGALMMWKMKKSGFFLYVSGQILPFIGLYGLMGGILPNSSGPLAGFVVFGQVVGVIFPLAFVIMYGLNYKHLK